MRIILNGGGYGERVSESYRLFSSLVKNKKIMYIPLAWVNGSYESCLDWFEREMQPFGDFNIDLITSADQITTQRLNKVDGIFIGGGNTYKLLKMLKESAAFNNLKEYAQKDRGVIMGGSAGALIFGKSIKTCIKDDLNIENCDDENLVGLKETDGFGFVGDFSILPHYKKKPKQIENTKQRIQRLLSKNYKLICIPEDSSVFISGDEIKVVGSQPVEIITGNQRYTMAETAVQK